MRRASFAITLALMGGLTAHADDSPANPLEGAVRQRINAYLDVFNSGDAEAVASFWAANAVSLDTETGERTVGRAALLADFKTLFKESPGSRLTGRIDHIRAVAQGVVIAEGEATLFTPGSEPTTSAFTAVMVKENGQWVIESSQERELAVPATPYEALQELEWLVGDWQDQIGNAEVQTTARWSANRAFLIRSFRADFGDGDVSVGTQIIGWDPRTRQNRAWSFNSDGAFGEGSVAKVGTGWLIKMTHVLGDGRTSASTQVITPIDQNTMRVEKIGQTVNGNMVPASEPLTVVRIPSGVSIPTATGAAQ